MTKIGFIGLGNMGLPMALNLSKAGHDVTGCDASEAGRAAARSAGLGLAATAAAAAAGADVVVMMLPNGAIAEAVATEALAAMDAGAVLIDCSTIDVAAARRIHEAAAAQEVGSLDAPVSGGTVGASAGTLTFMVGGSEDAFAAGAPLFEIMGQKAVHCGAGGAGQAAKVCNNMLLAISMIGSCEAFRLADALGLDRQALFDVVSTASGYCWSVNVYCPAPGVGPQSPADNGYKPGFAAALMQKDLGLAMEAAAATGANTPLGAEAKALYDAMVGAGQGDVDFSGMINFLGDLKRGQ